MQVEEKPRTSQEDRPICGLPVDATILFSNKKGLYSIHIEKNRTKLLQKIGFIRKFLDADERIIFVTTGCSPFSAVEQMTTGQLWLVMIKRALFVFTTKRLFHIPTTTKYVYRGSISQILYEDCSRLHVKGSMLVAEYRSGKKERFYGIPSGDRAIIKRFKIAPAESDRPSARPQRNHLCPSCTHILPPRTFTCPSCGLEFRDKAKALRYSLLYPGGGYFYTNHYVMGVLDALVETYLLIFALIAGVASLLGDPEALSTFILFALVLAVEKLITVYHSNNFLAEFVPKDLKRLLSEQTVPTELPPIPEPPKRERRIEEVLSVR